jgi:hypothetical protein
MAAVWSFADDLDAARLQLLDQEFVGLLAGLVIRIGHDGSLDRKLEIVAQ